MDKPNSLSGWTHVRALEHFYIKWLFIHNIMNCIINVYSIEIFTMLEYYIEIFCFELAFWLFIKCICVRYQLIKYIMGDKCVKD